MSLQKSSMTLTIMLPTKISQSLTLNKNISVNNPWRNKTYSLTLEQIIPVNKQRKEYGYILVKTIPITKPYNEVNTCLTFGLIIPVNFIFKSEYRKGKFYSQAISWNNAIYPIQNQFFNYNKEHFNLELPVSIKEIPNSMSEVINLDSIIKYITKFPIIQSNLFKFNQIFSSMINYSITRECDNTQIVLKKYILVLLINLFII